VSNEVVRTREVAQLFNALRFALKDAGAGTEVGGDVSIVLYDAAMALDQLFISLHYCLERAQKQIDDLQSNIDRLENRMGRSN
jgi:hypothetical protein